MPCAATIGLPSVFRVVQAQRGIKARARRPCVHHRGAKCQARDGRADEQRNAHDPGGDRLRGPHRAGGAKGGVRARGGGLRHGRAEARRRRRRRSRNNRNGRRLRCGDRERRGGRHLIGRRFNRVRRDLGRWFRWWFRPQFRRRRGRSGRSGRCQSFRSGRHRLRRNFRRCGWPRGGRRLGRGGFRRLRLHLARNPVIVASRATDRAQSRDHGFRHFVTGFASWADNFLTWSGWKA